MQCPKHTEVKLIMDISGNAIYICTEYVCYKCDESWTVTRLKEYMRKKK